MWHSVHFVHVALGIAREKKQWLRDCRRYWERAGVPAAHFHIKIASTPATHVANICDTFALYMIFWMNVLCGRTSALVVASGSFLRRACLRMRETLCSPVVLLVASIRCRDHQSPLHLRRGQWITGIRRAVEQMQVQARDCVIQTWTSMCNAGTLCEPFDQEEHEITNVVHFATFFCKERWSRGQHVGIQHTTSWCNFEQPR